MASKKITDLTADTAPGATDLVVTVDVADTTDSAQGTNKKVTINDLFNHPAGTTALAPARYNSGANLTGQGTAGAIEYDGTTWYSTPVTNARGVTPSMMYSIVSSSDFTLATTTGVQSAFEATGDVWTLAATTSYFFEGFYQVTKTTTSITVAMAFAFSSAPTSILYTATSWATAVNTTVTASSEIHVAQASTTVITIASTGAIGIRFNGIIRTNGATTMTPQVNWSANTTVPVMKANSYIRLFPIGTNTNNILGNVA